MVILKRLEYNLSVLLDISGDFYKLTGSERIIYDCESFKTHKEVSSFASKFAVWKCPQKAGKSIIV